MDFDFENVNIVASTIEDALSRDFQNINSGTVGVLSETLTTSSIQTYSFTQTSGYVSLIERCQLVAFGNVCCHLSHFFDYLQGVEAYVLHYECLNIGVIWI